MFFTIRENELMPAKWNELNADEIRVGYVTKEELKECSSELGLTESAVNDCIAEQTHFRNSIDVYDDFTFGIINIVNIMNAFEERDRIGFFIKKNLFILVKLIDKDDSVRELFENSVGRFTQNATLEKVIFGILERLLVNGNKVLEITERRIMKLEESLVNGKISKNLNKEIFDLKNQMSILKNYYEQLVSIGEELQQNEIDIFEEENLRYFKVFTDKAIRLSTNTQALCDSLVHVREALDAVLSYNLNSIMKVFTVVTTIFMPLTLIVGWYGMNFKYMPELSWKYGYLTVIILSVFVVIFCLFFFKRKKLF